MTNKPRSLAEKFEAESRKPVPIESFNPRPSEEQAKPVLNAPATQRWEDFQSKLVAAATAQ